MSEIIFDKRKIKTFSNCEELVKSMVGTRDGLIAYNEKFRLDLENTCYKANMCENLQQERNNYKELYEKENKNWNELKEWLEEEKPTEDMNENFIMIRLSDLKEKIQEIERK